MFGQTFQLHDLAIIGILIVLEGVLSIDNALVLGLLAKRLPRHLQPRALTYGLVGAFVFRVLAIAVAGALLTWHWPKLVGGAYLLWVAIKHFVWGETPQDIANSATNATDAIVGTELTHTYVFWSTVVVIELTDIAFAVDSILAAIGTVPGREKLWLVVVGGMLGVILMRFAATLFIRLLDRFPRFELSAYLLVFVIGLKLVVDYIFNRGDHERLNFHHPSSLAFWVFWGLMAVCFAMGFIPPREAPAE
jgi:YkoY family integral membrane protein